MTKEEHQLYAEVGKSISIRELEGELQKLRLRSAEATVVRTPRKNTIQRATEMLLKMVEEQQ